MRITKTENEGLVFIFTRAFHFHKNILPRGINRVYYEREISIIFFGGNFMIFITIIASLIALNLIDNKITENENKMYDIIDSNENKEK